MLFAQTDEVALANKRFAACIQEYVGAHFLGLADDIVEFLEAQAFMALVFVVCRPASFAAQVAGGGGIHEDGPGHIAVVLGRDPALLCHSQGDGVHEEVPDEGAGDFRVDVIANVLGKQMDIAVRVCHGACHHIERIQRGLLAFVSLSGKAVHELDYFGKVTIEILAQQVI